MTPVERVARAIDPEVWNWWDTINGSSPPGTAENIRRYEPIVNDTLIRARAAIEALREPPENYQEFGTDKLWKDRTSADVWRDMIDAILSGEPQPVQALSETEQ